MKPAPYDPSMRRGVLALWSRCLGERFPLTERLFVQNLEDDPHYDPEGAVVLVRGREPMAAASARVCRVPLGNAGRKAGEGWLSFVLVHPDCRRRGHGRELVEAALGFLRSRGVERVYAGGDPGHFFPGVPEDSEGAVAFFERCGFAPAGQAHDFAGGLESLRPDRRTKELLEDPHVRLGPLERAETEAFRAFMAEHFGGRWRYEMERRLAVEPDPGFLVVLRLDGAIAGFANTGGPSSRLLSPGLYWSALLEGPSGCLGPIGVGEPFRGKGLGLALLYGAFAAMRDSGIARVVVDWTVLDDFYGKMGLRRWKSYRMMRAELPPR